MNDVCARSFAIASHQSKMAVGMRAMFLLLRALSIAIETKFSLDRALVRCSLCHDQQALVVPATESGVAKGRATPTRSAARLALRWLATAEVKRLSAEALA